VADIYKLTQVFYQQLTSLFLKGLCNRNAVGVSASKPKKGKRAFRFVSKNGRSDVGGMRSRMRKTKTVVTNVHNLKRAETRVLNGLMRGCNKR